MTNRKLLLATIFATALGAALPAAAARVDFYVNTAPPAPLYEAVPAPRAGWVWAPGYWEWRHGRHVWVSGHWLRARHGYRYAPGAWVMRDGRYYYRAPGWQHGDRDGDGVPNRYDRAPNNPYVR
jgi:hypothetical protein